MSDDEIRTMVKEWLHGRQLKSYQLAEKIGIRPQTFYAQMSVRNISARTKRALASVIPALKSEAPLNIPSPLEEHDPEKIKIREWLKKQGKTRQWLAEQCRVSVRTVHTWFTVRGNIPVTQSLFINKLMQESFPAEHQFSNTILVSFSDTEMGIIHQFRESHPTIDLNVYGTHKILELCINMLTLDQHAQGAPCPAEEGFQRLSPEKKSWKGAPGEGLFKANPASV